MHVSFGTALVVTAMIASIILVLERGDRLFPLIALVAAGIEALIVFGVISLSSRGFRIDVILPGLLLLAGGICWSKSSTKSTITAATAIALVGTVQLLMALNVFR